MKNLPTANDVLQFWFNEISPEDHFKKNNDLDKTIKDRFEALFQAASKSELWQWRGHAESALAEIIVLDQFSRNIYRDDARAFASDPLALCLAQEAVAKGYDNNLKPEHRAFLYMPYMHSESKSVHQVALQLFDQPGLENNLKFEIAHKEIIDQFGRYPHRNKVLGRESTAKELVFLETHSGF